MRYDAKATARHLVLTLANAHVPDESEVVYLCADWWALFPFNRAKTTAVASAILSDEELRHMVRAFDVKHQNVGIHSIEEGLQATLSEYWEWVAPGAI